MNRTGHIVGQAALVAALAITVVLISATSAFALKVNYVRYTNPVAYDIKSLQWTHFYASVDMTGALALLSSCGRPAYPHPNGRL